MYKFLYNDNIVLIFNYIIYIVVSYEIGFIINMLKLNSGL